MLSNIWEDIWSESEFDAMMCSFIPKRLQWLLRSLLEVLSGQVKTRVFSDEKKSEKQKTQAFIY